MQLSQQLWKELLYPENMEQAEAKDSQKSIIYCFYMYIVKWILKKEFNNISRFYLHMY